MAITRLLSDPKALDKGVVLLAGNVAIGGSGAVGTVEGKGVTVALGTTGVYTFTLAGSGTVDVLAAFFMQEAVSATSPLHIVISARDDSARTITITCTDADTPAATNPGNGDKIHFFIVVKNSSAR